MLFFDDTYLAIPEIGIRWWNPLTESMTHDESSDVTKSLIFNDLWSPGMMTTDWDMLERHSDPGVRGSAKKQPFQTWQKGK